MASQPSVQEIASCATGVALWIGVAHGFLPRRRWSVPIGLAIAAGIFALVYATVPRARWAAPAVGGGLGALIALLLGVVAEAIGRRLRPGATRTSRIASPPVIRLWRGELHILVGVGSLLIWLAAVLWAGAAVSAVSLVHFPRPVALVEVGLWLAWPIGTAAALVGLWRSTRRDAPRPLWRPLAWLARAGLLAGLALAAIVAAAIGPDVLRDSLPLAFGASERSTFTLRVLRGGTELELAGELGFGVTEEVRKALDGNPRVRLLHLDSPGGRVVEGGRMAALVQERRLATHVAHECQSACVEVLAAGEPRLLGRHAVIGLHRASPLWSDGPGPRPIDRQAVERLVALGVDRAFAERGAATPNEEVWRPTHEEIFAARLATRHARDDEVALSGYTPEALERLPLVLREEALFQALFEFERPTFDRWVAAVRDGHARGVSLAEAVDAVRPQLDEVVQRAVSVDAPRASTGPLRAFVEAMVGTMQEARAAGPGQCAALIRGRLGRGPEQAAPGRRLGDALAAVLASARLEPAAPPPLDSHDPDLVRIVARLDADHPGFLDLVDDPAGAAKADPSKACLLVDGTIDLYQKLLKLPPGRGTPLLRGLLAESDRHGKPGADR